MTDRPCFLDSLLVIDVGEFNCLPPSKVSGKIGSACSVKLLVLFIM